MSNTSVTETEVTAVMPRLVGPRHRRRRLAPPTLIQYQIARRAAIRRALRRLGEPVRSRSAW